MSIAASLLPLFSGVGFSCAASMAWQALRETPDSDDRSSRQGVLICGAFLLLWMICASCALSDLANAVDRIEAGQGCPSPRKPHPDRANQASA